MSRQFRCLSTSLRCIPTGSVSVSVPSGVRRYVQAALKTRPEQQQMSTPQRKRHKEAAPTTYIDDGFDSSSMYDMGTSSTLDPNTGQEGEQKINSSWTMKRKPEPYFAEHLNGLFPALQFPDELARRILTHGSHPAAMHGHNAGLSFLGRRVLESYFHLFVNSSSALQPKHDLENLALRTISTHVLGQYVGTPWGLGRAMRWTPTIAAEKLEARGNHQALLKSVGLYKVQGDAVAAVMGGIFFQFGASVAHRVFHTRLLPHLLLPGYEGLPEAFHADAQAACERMGGVDGELLLDLSGNSTPSETDTVAKQAAWGA